MKYPSAIAVLLLVHCAIRAEESGSVKTAGDVNVGATDRAGVLTEEKNHGVLATLVGERGDPASLDFEGNLTFPSGKLRDALTGDMGFNLVSHPEAPMDGCLKMLRRKIVSGYQHGGFPDAQVTATFDVSTGRIRVQINEGRRFRCGAVNVSGIKPALAAMIVDRLTKPKPADYGDNSSSAAKTNDITGNNLTGEGRDPRSALATKRDDSDSCEGPLWTPGEPAFFGQAGTKKIETLVKDCLAEDGLFFPRLNIRTELKPATSTADLHVEIMDKGPLGTVSGIEVTGNRTNTSADILKFLELKPGMAINRARITQAEQKLWCSARFLNYKITPVLDVKSSTNSNQVQLNVNVQEYGPAPRLVDTLSGEEKALLRLCDWLSALKTRSEDAIISMTYYTNGWPGKSSAEFFISPRQGALVQFSIPASVATNFSYAMLFARHNMGIYASGNGCKLVDANPELVTLFYITMLPNEVGSDQPFNLQIGGGWQQLSNTQLKSGTVPSFNLELNLAPVAFLSRAHQPGFRCTLKDNLLFITSSNSVMKADATTGQLLDFSYQGTNLSGSLRFAGGVFEQARRDLDLATADFSNRFEPEHPLGSSVGFFSAEIARWGLMERFAKNLPVDQRLRAVNALNKLLAPGILWPIDRMFGSTNHEEVFVIPPDEQDRAKAKNSQGATCAGLAFRFGNDLFPKYSWPWTVVHESVFVLAGETAYTCAELNRLCESEQTGPIGCLFIADLLSGMDSSNAHKFALRGLSRLDSTDFQKECQVFLTGDSSLARCLANLSTTLRELSPEDVDALAAALPPAESRLLKQCAQALRATPSKPPAMSLTPSLNDYWQVALCEKVRSALLKLASPPVK